jgi:hypothetical protein
MRPLSQRMAEKRRSKRQRLNPPHRTVDLKLGELPLVIDVLFTGLIGDLLGHVVASASPLGRKAVEEVFPDAHIQWRSQHVKQFPDDWMEFDFPLRDLIEYGPIRHSLDRRLIESKPLDEVSAEQFALLMAFATKDQGARSAIFSIADQDISIFKGASNRN